MSLHVLHIFSTFKIGGPQVRFAALAAGLGDAYAHTVIAMDGCYDALRCLPAGLRVEIGHAPAHGAALPARLAAYRRRISTTPPDLLVTYNWGAIEWAMANAFTGVRHIHIADGFGPEEAAGQFRRRIWTRRLALRGSDVIVPSRVLQDIAERIWRLPAGRIRYIPNGIEPQDSYQTCLSAIVPDLPPSAPRIVWAGALRPEKNPVRMVRAFAPLKDQAVLLIAGDGPEREAVEREISRQALGARVRLLGARDDVRDLLMQCDVLAMSSDTEQMPLAVLEAMDAGLPVASVDVGDVRVMVAEENRPFISGRAGSDLSTALSHLIADASKRKGIGELNRRRVRATYSRSAMVAAYRNAFTSGAPA